MQGLAQGIGFPVIYNIFNIWTSPKDKATLMGIAFAGIAFANIVTYPVSSALCLSGIDGGWPMVFYVPAAFGLVWIVLHLILTSDSPEDHPNISEEEKIYLRHHSCANVSQETKLSMRDLPWKQALTSIPVHTLWITHFAISWLMYLIALNIPIYVNEVFNFGIIYVSIERVKSQWHTNRNTNFRMD